MEIVKSKMANALSSKDRNHVIAVADDIYDEAKGAYQSDINDHLAKGEILVDGDWVPNSMSIPVATNTNLGGIKTGDGTGVKVEDQIIKADFDTTDYSSIPDPTTHDFATNKVASPDTVKQIFDKYNQTFLDTLGDVEIARLNLYNAIYGADYTESSQIPSE